MRRRGSIRGTRRTWLAPRAAALLAAVALLGASPVPAVEWEKISDRQGELVERRVIPGSPINEVRVTAYSPLAPAALFDALWKQQEHPEFVPYLKRLTLISDTGDERVVYEQLALPLLRDRDYTVRLRKSVDLAAQRYGVLITSANDVGPPADGNYVRVTHIQGSWLIEPSPDGTGTLIRYQMQCDPGGLIPAWAVNRAQRDAAANLVRAMLKRAQEKSGAK
jgi:ribosome-associated toxin RatA of RatAB toxin-antitoxin module